MKKTDTIIQIREANDITRNSGDCGIGESVIWFKRLVLTSMGKKQGTAVLDGDTTHTRQRLYAGEVGKTLFSITDMEDGIAAARDAIRVSMERFMRCAAGWEERQCMGWEDMVAAAETVRVAYDAEAWKTVPVIDMTQEWIDKGWCV